MVRTGRFLSSSPPSSGAAVRLSCDLELKFTARARLPFPSSPSQPSFGRSGIRPSSSFLILGDQKDGGG